MYCRLRLILYIRGVFDCNEWKTVKRHECANMGKVKRLEYDGNCTARHFRFGT